MTQFFTDREKADFQQLGWDVCGSSAYLHLESVGLGINVEADGDLMIQSEFEGGRWKWVYGARCETARLAACVAADFFFAKTGWELLSWRAWKQVA